MFQQWYHLFPRILLEHSGCDLQHSSLLHLSPSLLLRKTGRAYVQRALSGQEVRFNMHPCTGSEYGHPALQPASCAVSYTLVSFTHPFFLFAVQLAASAACRSWKGGY